MKNLLKMSDLSPAELTHILDVADQLKAQQKLGGTAPLLAGKTVALMFSKASTRTRTSFEVGVYQMGGLGNYMNTAELQAGRGEPLRDTARVLGRYYDCAVWRTYRQRDLEELAELSGIPVINGLTDYAHPCQVLADLMTIRERKSTFDGLKMCFIGDGNNMANSLIVGGLKVGMEVSIACPIFLFAGIIVDSAVIMRFFILSGYNSLIFPQYLLFILSLPTFTSNSKFLLILKIYFSNSTTILYQFSNPPSKLLKDSLYNSDIFFENSPLLLSTCLSNA